MSVLVMVSSFVSTLPPDTCISFYFKIVNSYLVWGGISLYYAEVLLVRFLLLEVFGLLFITSNYYWSLV